jgi:uncharacterized membrane-anchored protein
MNNTGMRGLIGFLVAPGAPALALYLVSINREGAPLTFLILAPLGYAAALVLGVPAYFAMQRRGIRSLLAYVLLGALIGLVFYVAFTLVTSYRGQAFNVLRNGARPATTAVIYAAVCSVLFWLIAIKPSRGP